MTDQCIIVGASHAGSQLALSLRQNGWKSEIVLIGAERYFPYHRPPLSKDFLNNKKTIEQLYIRNPDLYESNDITVRLDSCVSRIDRENACIELDDGELLEYGKLALCMGARVREIPIPGADLEGVHYLRNVDDIERIQQDLIHAKNAVIIGAGYIGLETAASLKKLGIEVSILETSDRVLQRVTSPEVSAFFTRIHQEEGVDIQTGSQVQEILGSGRVEAILCEDGAQYEADLVIVGIGVIPNTELAEKAGLEVDNGIVVNELAVTSDPDIVAAGDITNHPNLFYGGNVRLESVHNAMEQSKTAAATLCGKREPFDSLPWFWSDQYDLKLQIAGLNEGYEEVIIRGNPEEGRSLTAFYLKEKRLIAADCINRPRDFMFSKRLIESKKQLDSRQLKDESVELKTLL